MHEQILPAIRRTGGIVQWSDVAIQHVGYQDTALRHRKLERDLRLLRMNADEQPDEPFILFNLGSVYLELNRVAEAIPCLERSIVRSHANDSIVRKLYALLIQAFRQLGQLREAWNYAQIGLEYYPQDAELLFLAGILQREQGDDASAEQTWLRLLSTQEATHFASVDSGLRGYKTRHNLAVLYLNQSRLAEAELQWRLALEEAPQFQPALQGLAELFRARGNGTRAYVVLAHQSEP